MKNKLLAGLFLLASMSYSQDVIDVNEFNDKSGIVVIEFTEQWNEKNNCFWLSELNNAEVFRMNLSSKLAKKLGIKSIPTIAVFKDTEFIQIFEADISFTLPENTKEEVQKTINKL